MSSEIAELFRRLTHGIYVIGVAHGDQRNAFTAAWLMQVSFDPLLLVLSINPRNASYPLLRDGWGFTVSVLKREQLELARHFGTRSSAQAKLARVTWRPGRTGAPILQEALAYFDCEVIEITPAGDHHLVLGRVIDGRVLDPGAVPLTYAETGDIDGSRAFYPRGFS